MAKLVDYMGAYQLAALLSGSLKSVETPPNALHTLGNLEVDQLIKRCDAALGSHSSDFRAGRDKDNALAALQSVVALLLMVRDVHPSHWPDIERVLARFGYSVPNE